MRTCFLGNPNSCLTMVGGFLKPHTLQWRKKSSKLETNLSKLQLSFPCHNRTPKHYGFLNTLHQTLGDDFTSCWGHVEEFLAAGEQEIAHTKPFFFLVASAATCTDSHLEVDQSFHLEYIELRFEYKIS
ncbi:hypothetical protein Taro_008303 [Colocasia esculenta]|uniref:Uncharacterized protein n=1 Tax=Colocasia esculenta TaxID=4460 RepID=A0A843U6L0_COLES|nr:hypothetical protein [Colocasia esculenta]